MDDQQSQEHLGQYDCIFLTPSNQSAHRNPLGSETPPDVLLVVGYILSSASSQFVGVVNPL